jgi:hypothetical protein
MLTTLSLVLSAVVRKNLTLPAPEVGLGSFPFRGEGGKVRRRGCGARRAREPIGRMQTRKLAFGYIGIAASSARAGSGAVGIKEANMRTAIPSSPPSRQAPWNKGRLTGQKRPLKPNDV